MRKIEREKRDCAKEGGGGERERGGGERFREHGIEIARDTKVLRKSELYTDLDISGEKNSQRTEGKKRRRERHREREIKSERERDK